MTIKAAAKSRRLYQLVATALIDGINAGRFDVGGRLPAERELAIEHSVSRPTVREAIIALEVQGLVEVRVGSGVYVSRSPKVREAPGAGISAFELTEARLLFEGEAAALAATMLDAADLDQLDNLVLQIDDENRRGVDGEHADRQFHVMIARSTGNAAILATIETLWDLRSTSPEASLLLAKSRAAKVQPVVAEHQAIATALRSRDPAAARAAMRSHLAQVIDHLLFTTEEVAVEQARAEVQSTRARFGRGAAL